MVDLEALRQRLRRAGYRVHRYERDRTLRWTVPGAPFEYIFRERRGDWTFTCQNTLLPEDAPAAGTLDVPAGAGVEEVTDVLLRLMAAEVAAERDD